MTETKTGLPRLFVGSSSEGATFADELQATLEARRAAQVTLWHQGVFGPSSYPIPALLQAAKDSDFAVLVATPDDLTESRGGRSESPRDNVVFELGLFLGVLGIDRTFLLPIVEGGALKLPSDLSGLNLLPFMKRDDDNNAAAVGPAATQLARAIGTHGRRERTGQMGPGSPGDLSLHRALDHIARNAAAQGWTIRKHDEGVLRMESIRRRRFTFSVRPELDQTDELRGWVGQLRASGLRVNHAARPLKAR